MDNVYQKDSISEVDGVPCFSVLDDYIENYEKISQDHLKVFLNTGHNPFMREDHWNEVENSTADLIKKYSNHKMKILDVGVGLGRLLEKFPELDRYGIDISDGYLNESKKKGN